ncbi:MAG: ArdC-like ssDNA-binding domain-containing protein [Ferrimicrobium sp.]
MQQPSRVDLLSQLTKGVQELTDSKEWIRYLWFQTKFREYSFRNTILIAAQCPSASQVAGYVMWRRLGRQVRKGERGIRIFAPMVVVAEESEVVRFRSVVVFDVSQTEGEEPPQVCRLLEGRDRLLLFHRLRSAASRAGYTVLEAVLPQGVNGDCTFGTRTIRVGHHLSGEHRCKTLAHELAHALLHEDQRDRQLAELEAESVAYVVCQTFGIDTSSYSFGYVANWGGCGDDAVALITASGDRIHNTSSWIVDNATVDGE